MRLSKELSIKMYNVLEKAKKVSRLNVSQNEFVNMCYTINALNALEEGQGMVGNYMVSDYKIPGILSDLIVPVKISLKEGIYARNIKSGEYKENAISDSEGSLLSPLDMELLWTTFLGAIKSQDTLKELTEARTSSILANLDSRTSALIKKAEGENGDWLMHSDDTVCPILVDIQVYTDKAYSMDIEEVFLNWWFAKIK